MPVIKGRQMTVADLVLAGAGIGMLLNSLLPWYGYDAPGWHPTYNGFQSGFLAFLPLLVVVLVAGAGATRAWTGATLGAVGRASWDLIFLVLDGVAALVILAFWLTLPSLDGASTGAKIGTYLGLILVLVQAAGALLAIPGSAVRIVARLRRRAA